METINISPQNVIKAYNQAENADVKQVLENLFGADAVKPKDMRERINDWDDILIITGALAQDFHLRRGETDDELAYRQAKQIAFAYNGNKVASLEEYRYYPWANLVKDSSKPSGFALSCDGCVDWDTDSRVGVRLCFSKSDHAKDAFKKFTPIYERLQIN
jgi:hypothetical protein